jgi:phosphohistidine phosphatase SixA
MKPIFVFSIFSILLQVIPISNLPAKEKLWDAFKSGNHIILIRHAFAPGFSDPENFNVKDCTTQRNLNNTGRNQARRIGDLFRMQGIQNARIYSSQWCRCLETAKLLKLGNVKILKSLNSFFEHLERKEKQTTATRKWIRNTSLDTPTVLVTHLVNITALTNNSISSGELVFVKRTSKGKLVSIGSIETIQ